MIKFRRVLVGLSSGNFPDKYCLGELPNSYAMGHAWHYCLLSGNEHDFEWPNDAIEPEWYGIDGDVIGCGLWLNSANELSIFFTGNGILMG
jgi:hypothetical protein